MRAESRRAPSATPATSRTPPSARWPPRPALLLRQGGETVVELADGEQGVAPGQACVFYESAEGAARVLGGGTIGRVMREGRRGQRPTETIAAAE